MKIDDYEHMAVADTLAKCIATTDSEDDNKNCCEYEVTETFNFYCLFCTHMANAILYTPIDLQLSFFIFEISVDN